MPATATQGRNVSQVDPRRASQREARRIAEQTISRGSKSFALSSRILPEEKRLDAWLLYSWCRHADDVIDQSPAVDRPAALLRLRHEVEALYDSVTLSNPLWEALREVLERRKMPQEYLSTMLDGMQMDVDGYVYRTIDDLLLYCHRVAGVVGFMMVQILGVDRRSALRPAAQLGLAMQLTNICRDVLEDWDNGRLYLPDEWLTEQGLVGLRSQLGSPFPREQAEKIAKVVERMLALADRFYQVSDSGTAALDARSAFAIRTARAVYSEIGRRVREQHCNVLKGRAIVSTRRKILLLGQSAFESVLEIPRRLAFPHVNVPLQGAARFPEDVLP